MHNLPVHWCEGLFLRPQHLQAADRSWRETLGTSEHWDHQYNYGLRRIELSEESISNWQLQVNACHARMKDGSLVQLDAGQELDRIDLKAAFDRSDTVRAYLAVPRLKLGQRNVSRGEDGEPVRYLEATAILPDESEGGNDQEVQLRRLNVRLLLSTEDLSGYELLPIAEIQRSGENESVPRLSSKYIPPLLAIDAWAGLGRDIVRAIYDLLGKKAEVLSQQVINRGISLVSQEPGDLDRLLMLLQLNTAIAALEVLAFAQGVHPLVAYVELCRIVGQLSIFGPSRRLPEIPHYDHDDLGRIFGWIREQIEILLGLVRDYEFEQRYFVGESRGMRVALDPKWLGADWKWFVGVQTGVLSERECLEMLSPGNLDWKLGSAKQVDALFQYGAEGLQLTPLSQAPRALPAVRDWVYYEVTRGNAAWKDVLDTQTLAMRLKDSLILNLDTLQGARKLVVSFAGKQVSLHFALFAVPNR
ncbi:MAG: type VI secretion system baseplate subunit TssK [Pirellulales bacterium]|jgi:type VI secretion system protein ImpJ|nr:type VI secretion system baseplate subunit TssK [Thermoguttaceae bacterium]MDD4788168.1 type VI secretion system baseplate subunit TssK [Pirellulales bacterium]MDI9443463.1 type VI secretion system baseplate subunit TssK [Planctomycetota bacterium]NLZ01326.1 type VI secretion system baseplate subunit TssK [Pirellulaceae bacterium]